MVRNPGRTLPQDCHLETAAHSVAGCEKQSSPKSHEPFLLNTKGNKPTSPKTQASKNQALQSPTPISGHLQANKLYYRPAKLKAPRPSEPERYGLVVDKSFGMLFQKTICGRLLYLVC